MILHEDWKTQTNETAWLILNTFQGKIKSFQDHLNNYFVTPNVAEWQNMRYHHLLAFIYAHI